jgi:hypothetical protein
MTPLVRRYIKTSFVFLMAGLLLGGWIIVAEFVLGRYPPRLFITAHVHLLLVGFMLMMVMGVATWMFPRPARDDASYRPALAEAVYWVMAIATALRAVAELWAGLSPAPVLRFLIAAGGLGQLAGASLLGRTEAPRHRAAKSGQRHPDHVATVESRDDGFPHLLSVGNAVHEDYGHVVIGSRQCGITVPWDAISPPPPPPRRLLATAAWSPRPRPAPACPALETGSACREE